MAVNPSQLIGAERPSPGVPEVAGVATVQSGGTSRRASKLAGYGDLNDLSGQPGSAGYAKRMEALRQDARARGEPEESQVVRETPTLILPESAQPAAAAPSATMRVAIYYGKGDTYNLAVESAPDWDTDTMLKALEADDVRMLLNLAKALGVKISDKTGDF